MRPLRAELVEPAVRRRRAGGGAPPRSQRMARRTENCPTRPSELTSGIASASPGPVIVAEASRETLSTDLSALAHVISAGLHTADDVTVSCNRFARGLLGSADHLLRQAVAFGAGTVRIERRGRPTEYALHWPSAYESDVWD